MKRQIWKFSPPWSDVTVVQLPKGAQVLAFDEQFEAPRIWAVVDPDEKEIETRVFRIAGTGHELGFDPSNLSYIGTAKFAGGSLIFHLLEVIGLHTDDLEIPEGMEISRPEPYVAHDPEDDRSIGELLDQVEISASPGGEG